MQQRFLRFISGGRVMVLATFSSEFGGVWSAPLCYFYSAGRLVFSSSESSAHIASALASGGRVSVSIYSCGWGGVRTFRGAQIVGRLHRLFPDFGDDFEKLRRGYYRRFLAARLRPAPLWIVEIESVKYTDNRVGFGTKFQCCGADLRSLY